MAIGHDSFALPQSALLRSHATLPRTWRTPVANALRLSPCRALLPDHHSGLTGRLTGADRRHRGQDADSAQVAQAPEELSAAELIGRPDGTSRRPLQPMAKLGVAALSTSPVSRVTRRPSNQEGAPSRAGGGDRRHAGRFRFDRRGTHETVKSTCADEEVA